MAGVQTKIPQHILLTGMPGVGKTTLIKKAHQELLKREITCSGFVTEEVRSGGRRIGFDIVTTDGFRDQLARISQTSSDYQPSQHRECRVGQYSVNVMSFEQVALNILMKKKPAATSGVLSQKQIFIIDEIGKMELFSRRFIETVKKILSQPSSTVIATIPVPKGRPIPFVEEVRNNSRSRVFEVTRENRDSIFIDIFNAVSASIGIDLNKDR